MFLFFFSSLQEILNECDAWIYAFAKYQHSDDPKLDDIKLPNKYIVHNKDNDTVDEYDLDENEVAIGYMIHLLFNGDISKKKWVTENLNYPDFFEYMSYEKYKNYCEKEANQRMRA